MREVIIHFKNEFFFGFFGCSDTKYTNGYLVGRLNQRGRNFSRLFFATVSPLLLRLY